MTLHLVSWRDTIERIIINNIQNELEDELAAIVESNRETEKQRENLISVQRERERELCSHSQSTAKPKM